MEGGLRRRLAAAVLAAVLVGLTAVAPEPAGAAPPTQASMCRSLGRWGGSAAAPAHVQRMWIDRCVRLNEVQAIGTHNSYHVQASPALFGLLTAFDATLAASIEYTHRPLAEQLDRGIRQFELDVF